MKNRYNELKNFYKDYIIIFKTKDKYKLMHIDKQIFNYLKIKNISKLKKYKINYLIVNNLDIEEKYEYENNRYYEFYLKIKLINTFEYIKERICVK